MIDAKNLHEFMESHNLTQHYAALLENGIYSCSAMTAESPLNISKYGIPLGHCKRLLRREGNTTSPEPFFSALKWSRRECEILLHNGFEYLEEILDLKEEELKHM